VVIGSESQEAYLRLMVPSYASWRYVNTHLPADARVLAFVNNDYLYCHLRIKSEPFLADLKFKSELLWGR
jgi:hypothetical protein